MSVRKTPFYQLQYINYINPKNLAYETPLDLIHQKLTIINGINKEEYNEKLKNEAKIQFTQKRDKIGRQTWFTSATPEFQQYYINLFVKSNEDKFYDKIPQMIFSSYNCKQKLLDNHAIYQLIDIMQETQMYQLIDKFALISQLTKMLQLPSMPGKSNRMKVQSQNSQQALLCAQQWINVLNGLGKIKQTIERASSMKFRQQVRKTNKQILQNQVTKNLDGDEVLTIAERQLSMWNRYANKASQLVYNKLFNDTHSLLVEDLTYLFEYNDEEGKEIFLQNMKYVHEFPNSKRLDALTIEELVEDEEVDEFMRERVDGFGKDMVEVTNLRFMIPFLQRGKNNIFCTSKGLYVVKEGETMSFIHRTQLDMAHEVVSEIVSMIVSVYHMFGEDEAQRMNSFYQQSYKRMSQCNYDECNILTVQHRDIEMLLFDCEGKEHVRQKLNELGNQYDGYILLHETLNYTDRTRLKPLQYSRMLRCFMSTHFNPISLLNEQQKCMTLVTQPDFATLVRLKNSVKQLIHRFFLKKVGHHPSTKGDNIQEWDEEVLAAVEQGYWIPIDRYQNVDFDSVGKAFWDDDAWTSKDSTNVPPYVSLCYSREQYQKLSLYDRREILYFKDKDMKEIVHEWTNRVLYNNIGEIPIRITVKPEQKETGRMIHMECAPVRKINSILQNNIIQIPSVFWGSLLGKSLPSKLKAVQRLISTAQKSQDEGMQVFFISLDFAKFGHTIPQQTDSEILEIIAQFFGQQWVANFMSVLDTSRLFVGYGPIDAEINNEMKADGQGMRNGLWQLLLLAALNLAAEQLYEQHPQLDGKRPICPVFFQDDHVLMVMWKPINKMNVEQEFEQLSKAIVKTIVEEYDKIGLQIEEQKTEVNKTRFKLLGDYFDLNGFIAVPGKAIQTMLRPSDHRAPSLVDYVSDFVTCGHSAVLSGLDPVEVYLSMVTLLPVKMHMFPFEWTNTSAMQVAVHLTTPVTYGGLGFSPFQHLYIGSNVNVEADMIYNYFEHCNQSSILADHCAAMLQRVTQQQRKVPKNMLAKEVERVLYSDEKSLEDKRNFKLVKERFYDTTKKAPKTLLQFLQEIHPYHQIQVQIDKIVKSASALELLPKGTILRCKTVERYNAYKITKIVPVDHKWVDDYSRLIDMAGERHGKIHYRTPSHLLLIPCTSNDLQTHLGVSIHRSLEQANPVILIHNVTAKPVVPIPVPMSSLLARQTQQVAETIYAHQSEYGEKANGVIEQVCSVFGSHVKPRELFATGEPVTYRDVHHLSLGPQTIVTWAGLFLRHNTIYMESFVDTERDKDRSLKRHMNYSLAQALAVLCKDDSKNFMYHKNLRWLSPDISSTTENQRGLIFRPLITNEQYTERKKVYDQMVKIVQDRQIFMSKEEKVVATQIQEPDKMLLKDALLNYARYATATIDERRRKREMIERNIINHNVPAEQLEKILKYRHFQYAMSQAIDVGVNVQPDEMTIREANATVFKQLLLEDVYEQDHIFQYVTMDEPIDTYKLQKSLYQKWVRNVYMERCHRGFPWLTQLSMLPNKWKGSFLTGLEGTQKQAFKDLLPTEYECKELCIMMEAHSILSIFLNDLDQQWMKSTKRVPMSLSLSPAQKVEAALRRIPKLWFRPLTLQIRSLPWFTLESLEPKIVRAFYSAWHDRYRTALREQVSVLVALDTQQQHMQSGDLDLQTKLQLRGFFCEKFATSEIGMQWYLNVIDDAPVIMDTHLKGRVVDSINKKFQGEISKTLEDIEWPADVKSETINSLKLTGKFVSINHQKIYIAVHVLRMLTMLYGFMAKYCKDYLTKDSVRNAVSEVISTEAYHICQKYEIEKGYKDMHEFSDVLTALYDKGLFGKASAMEIMIEQLQLRVNLLCEDQFEERFKISELQLKPIQNKWKFKMIQMLAKVEIIPDLHNTPLLQEIFSMKTIGESLGSMSKVLKTQDQLVDRDNENKERKWIFGESDGPIIQYKKDKIKQSKSKEARENKFKKLQEQQVSSQVSLNDVQEEQQIEKRHQVELQKSKFSVVRQETDSPSLDQIKQDNLNTVETIIQVAEIQKQAETTEVVYNFGSMNFGEPEDDMTINNGSDAKTKLF